MDKRNATKFLGRNRLMSALNGEEYYESHARDFEACYAALRYMDQHDTDQINLDDLDDYDLVESGIKVTWGLLFDSPDITRDTVQEHLDNYLSFDVDIIYRLTLSYGGPNAWVEVRTYGGMIREMTYYFAWGSTTYERRLAEDEPMGRWAASEAERMMEMEGAVL